jgi:hypothetical protein
MSERKNESSEGAEVVDLASARKRRQERREQADREADHEQQPDRDGALPKDGPVAPVLTGESKGLWIRLGANEPKT